MDLLEEACYHASKEIVNQDIAENNRLTKIIQADDVIEIQAELIDSTTKKRLSLADDFIDRMKQRPASNQRNITGYVIPNTNEYITTATYFKLADKSAYNPVYKIIQKVNDFTVTAYEKNKLSLKINKLSHFDASRYSSLIQAMQDSNLFEFNRRTPATHKRTYNAIRQTLLRRCTVKGFEWGLIFNHDISKVIYQALPRMTHAIKKDNTYYLHDSPRSQCKIKIYNIDAASPERINQPLQFKQGDRLKLEITFKTEYFRSHPELTINKLTYQNTISDLLYNDNKKLLDKHLIRHLKPNELRDIMSFAEVKTKGDFMAIISDNRTTQTDTDKRLSKLEAHLEELDRMVSLNSQMIKDNNAENKQAINEIKDFINYKETKIDKRKLRAV